MARPRISTTEIGAKKGSECPNTWVAISQATPAARQTWMMRSQANRRAPRRWSTTPSNRARRVFSLWVEVGGKVPVHYVRGRGPALTRQGEYK